MRKHRRGPGHENEWVAAVDELRSEKFGTELARHHEGGNLTEVLALAGHHYAVLVRRYDRFFGLKRRHIPGIAFDGGSIAYDGGIDVQEGEVQRHEREGTINEYERRAKRIKKEWERAQNALANKGVREVVDRVCIYDQPIPFGQRPVLAAALERLARVFGFKARGERRREIRTSHQPGAKLGSKGNR